MDYYERNSKSIIYESLREFAADIITLEKQFTQEVKNSQNPYAAIELRDEYVDKIRNQIKFSTDNIYKSLVRKTNGIL